MVPRVILVLSILLVLATGALADDLYKVTLSNRLEAERLAATGVEAIVKLNDGYLVVADAGALAALQRTGLGQTLIRRDVLPEQLFVDNRLDRANVGKYPLVFEQEQVRVFDLGRAAAAASQTQLDVHQPKSIDITWDEAYTSLQSLLAGIDGLDISLDSLISLVNYDSLHSYMSTLQAFNGRVAGTAQNRAARDWLSGKFSSFGFDSVYIQPFTAYLGSVPTTVYNVVAVKPGSQLPDHQIVVGAHFDAVPGSPGADDNGSGTAGVLEVARILQDLDVDMTFIFVCFDAEEYGLYGSWYYADQAAARGDNIIYMLNMDMIANISNSSQANVFHGSDATYSELWIAMAESLVGIAGELAGSAGNSDHYPFSTKGWPVSFVHEYNFSTVYHSYRDSTTYMNFTYMRKMIQASLATVYALSDNIYGVEFLSTPPVGWVPFSVDFDGYSYFSVDNWTWDFGDGGSAGSQNVTHEYTQPGVYDVELQVSFDGGTQRSHVKYDYVIALADTMIAQPVSGPPGSDVVVSIYGHNTTPLHYIQIPIEYTGDLNLYLDSINRAGCRTDYFEVQNYVHWNRPAKQVTMGLLPSTSPGLPDLDPGAGDLIKFYFSIPADAQPGQMAQITVGGYLTYDAVFGYSAFDYQPIALTGLVSIGGCCKNLVGNVNGDANDDVDISDLTALVNYLFVTFDPLACRSEANTSGDAACDVDISDITALVNSLFVTFDPLPACMSCPAK